MFTFFLLRHSSATYHLHHHRGVSLQARRQGLNDSGHLLVCFHDSPRLQKVSKQEHLQKRGGTRRRFCRRFMWLAVAFGLHELLRIPKGKERMNKKGVHLVGRNICRSPLPLTMLLSNVILLCRNEMDNEFIYH